MVKTPLVKLRFGEPELGKVILADKVTPVDVGVIGSELLITKSISEDVGNALPVNCGPAPLNSIFEDAPESVTVSVPAPEEVIPLEPEIFKILLAEPPVLTSVAVVEPMAVVTNTFATCNVPEFKLKVVFI